MDEKENLIPDERGEVVDSSQKAANDAKAEGKFAVKKGLVVMLIALLIGALMGFGGTSIVLGARNNKEKIFTASEFQITLTEAFSEKLMANVTMAYSSRNMSVTFRKGAFTSSNKDFSAEQYARSVMLASGIVSEVKVDGDLTYFAANGTSNLYSFSEMLVNTSGSGAISICSGPRIIIVPIASNFISFSVKVSFSKTPISV